MSAKALQKLDTTVADRLKSSADLAIAAFSNTQGGAVDIISALDAAQHVQDLRDLFDLPQVRERIVALQDSPIGFRTDHDPKQKKKGPDGKKTEEYNTPYPYPVVRDCAIEATLRGLQLVGNQFNIIAYRCYVTKEGFEGLIRKVKGLSNFAPTLGVPRKLTDGALVDCSATWTLNGQTAECKATIPVRYDSYSSADQTLGKAARKFLKRCYEQMTGVSVPEGEEEEPSPQITAPEPAPTRRGFKAQPKTSDDQVPGAEVPPSQPITRQGGVIPNDATPANPETAIGANREPADSQGGGSDPAPAASPALVLDPNALNAEQAKLAEWVKKEGYDWDVLQTAVIRTNMFPSSDMWTGYADVPSRECLRILNSHVGMRREMAKVAASA